MTTPGSEAKRHAPATARNRQPILDVLRRVLPRSGTVLEVASGTGEHAVFLAAAMPNLTWQPSDAEAASLDSIRAWTLESGLENLAQPLFLNTMAEEWPIASADAVVCINMIHIAPWRVTLGLMKGAGRLLGAGDRLILYGPFKIEGRHTAPSNVEFDNRLKAINADFGVRDMADVIAAAEPCGFVLEERADMPANNFIMIFRKKVV